MLRLRIAPLSFLVAKQNRREHGNRRAEAKIIRSVQENRRGSGNGQVEK